MYESKNRDFIVNLVCLMIIVKKSEFYLVMVKNGTQERLVLGIKTSTKSTLHNINNIFI